MTFKIITTFYDGSTHSTQDLTRDQLMNILLETALGDGLRNRVSTWILGSEDTFTEKDFAGRPYVIVRNDV